MADIDLNKTAGDTSAGAAAGGPWGAVIAGAASVGTQLLANKNKQQRRVMPGTSLGQASQIQPQASAFEPLVSNQGVGPAFGQFLGG